MNSKSAQNASSVSPSGETYDRAGKEIFHDIKNRIIRGELLPGDRLLSERKLMEVYHRSRPTVREALRMLDRAGFIKISPRRSPVVLEYTGSSMERPLSEAIEAKKIPLSELREFRAALEGATVYWAAERRTEEDVRTLHRCLTKMRDSVDDYLTFLQLDIDFHACIARASKNRTAEVILASVQDISRDFTKEDLAKRTDRGRRSRCREIYKLHIPIYECIRDQRPSDASEAMMVHLTAFEKDISKASNNEKE